MANYVLRLPEVIKRTGLARSTIYDQMEKGTFPRPIRIGERAVAWRDSDIEDWIASRPSATPSGAPRRRGLRSP